ncbi:nitronate monooxygenase [Streptomyces flaveolus]|uniref:nitronate monooxygenase n=1 Tax=Streptomyces flaveolus TaxID=67297 RepID=UPI003818CD06
MRASLGPGRHAAETGADLLIVQAPAAGGHSATLTPDFPLAPNELPDLVSGARHTVALPVIAVGGITTPADTATALRAAPTPSWSAPPSCAPTKAARPHPTKPPWTTRRSPTPR